MAYLDNDDQQLRRIKVSGYFKTNSRGHSFFVSPHYRVMLRSKLQLQPSLKRRYLVKIPKTD